MATSTEREVVARYLSAGELLDVCRAGGRRAALDRVRARCIEGCHSTSGGDLDYGGKRDGIAWHTKAGESGFLRWDDVWRIATAGATPERVETLRAAYRAYIDHTTSFVACPGPWGTRERRDTRERWFAEYGNAYYARYGELCDAIEAAERAIVTQPLVEQLDLFGDAA